MLQHLRSEDYAALLDGAPDAIVVVDQHGRIEFANRRTTDLFGWRPDELFGRTIEMLVPDRLHDSHFSHRKGYLESPSTRPMGSGRSLFARRRDGSEFPVEISLSPLHTERGVLVSSIIRDVTERVRREEELDRLRELAEAANSAKSEFLSSMSHELRTPLNAVLGFAQLLVRARKNPLDQRQREMVAHIAKAGEHLLHLIDQILDLARIEARNVAISTEPVDIAGAIAEVMTSLETVAVHADIVIELATLPPTVGSVAADRTRLVQILMNFGSNAVKYGRQGGRIVFGGGPTASGQVRITVSDDGLGIPSDKQSLVFQPFQRAGQERGTIEGTGIGLAISKRLAEIMGGRLGFESEHGHGSSFWVELPRSEARADVEPPPASARTHASVLVDPERAEITVVYVEDNPANVALMAHVMAQFDRVTLLTAPTAEQGIELIRARLPAAVIMDINLPGMSGIEATRRLRESPQTSGIPIIGLSAAAMPRERAVAAEAGFFRYLTKPFDCDEMIATLEAVLERSEHERERPLQSAGGAAGVIASPSVPPRDDARRLRTRS